MSFVERFIILHVPLFESPLSEWRSHETPFQLGYMKLYSLQLLVPQCNSETSLIRPFNEVQSPF